MDNQEIETLLKKYRQGKATDEEIAFLESWYLERDLNSITKLSSIELTEDLEHIGKGLPLLKPVRKINWWFRVAAVAAVFTIFFMAYLEWPVLHRRLHPIQLITLNVLLHQKKQITLADGSQVWVNGGSELKYPKVFNNQTREVYLSGEAYFDVHHDPAKSFIIHTANLVTNVLGTAFNVKEDKNKHTIEVTVTRGEVSVANDGKQLGILTPNQQIIIDGGSGIRPLGYDMLAGPCGKAIQQKVNAMEVVAWQKIDFQFEDVTFAVACRQLEQRFKVKIVFKNDRIKSCRFTGASFTGDKLEKVLKTICDFNNATYKKLPDGSISIDGPGCEN